MFNALRQRLRVSPTTVIATLALVFAMTGGAYAAKKYLITSTKQISPSVLKSLKGASGKVGPAGATGAAGPAGTVGGAGPAGTAGTAGTDGKEGSAGKEGPPGKNGKDGSPWTAGGTLPKGSTETGTWTTGLVPAGAGLTALRASISIPIPLAAPIAASNVHVFEGTTVPTGCSGTVVESTVTELKATSGNFCVWVREGAVKATQLVTVDPEGEEAEGVGTHGTLLSSKFEGFEEETEAQGTWAVTG